MYASRWSTVIVIAVAVIADHGCKVVNRADTGSNDAITSIPPRGVKGIPVVGDSAIGRPLSIGVTNRWLVITDIDGPPFVHLVDRTTGKRHMSFGIRGSGPGDFVDVPK